MKRKLVYLCFMLCMLAGLSACSDKDTYLNVIPKDASYVVSFDVVSMLKKADLNKEMQTKILDFGKGMQPMAIFRELMENPEKSGLKLKKPLYLFGSTNYLAITASVDDKDDLNNLVERLANEQICEKPVKDGDFSYAKIKAGGTIAFNGETLLLLGKLDGAKDFAKMLLTQNEADYFVKTKNFEELKQEKGDIDVWFSYGALMNNNVYLAMTGIKMDNVDWNKVRALVNIDFLDGEMKLKFRMLSDDPNYSKMIEQQRKMTGRIKGEFSKRVSAGSMFWVMANLKGKALIDYLKSLPQLTQKLNEVPEFERIEHIISSINGDVAFSVSQLNMSNPMAGGVFYAKIDNKDFLNDINYFIAQTDMSYSSIKVSKSGDNGYHMTIDDLDNPYAATKEFFFGVKDDYFYFTGNEALIDGKIEGKDITSLPLDVTKYVSAVYLDFTPVNDLLTGILNKPEVAILKSLEAYSDGDKVNEMSIKLKNEKENFLKQVFELISKVG